MLTLTSSEHQTDPPVTLSEWRITADDVRSDVGHFARSVVKQQLPKKDAALRESLAAQMADKCDGMFLWIRLQERRLRGGRHNNKRLQDMVQQMPPGLDCLYDRNVAEIMRLEGHHQCRALAILRWTAFALRPLTVDEITDALAVVDDDDYDDLCVDELPDAVDDEYVEDEIVDICRSLVEVRRDTASDSSIGSCTIHFVYFSIRQYLLSTTLPPGLHSVDGIPARASRRNGASAHQRSHAAVAEPRVPAAGAGARAAGASAAPAETVAEPPAFARRGAKRSGGRG
jgi:hypothetical protein